MKTVLFVHQSAELYGSDRTLLSLVAGLDRGLTRAVVAVPGPGPLVGALREAGATVHALPLARLERSTLRAAGVAALPWRLWESARALDDVLRGETVDLVCTNTLAVLSGAVWARRRSLPHLWHVHEIVTHPGFVRDGFAHMLRAMATRVVFNSQATQRCYVDRCAALEARSEVVLNGVRRPPPDPSAAAALRAELGLEPESLLVVHAGRISRWKGQHLLVEAVERLARAGGPRLVVAFAGDSPPGQERFRDDLEQRARSSPLRHDLRLLGFRDDVWPLLDAADIVVVPSTEPEPFGLVAAEAMLAGKPVVASAHGGLLEIVQDGVTGRLVTPNDAGALAAALGELAGGADLRARLGARARAVAEDRFSEDRYVREMGAALERARLA